MYSIYLFLVSHAYTLGCISPDPDLEILLEVNLNLECGLPQKFPTYGPRLGLYVYKEINFLLLMLFERSSYNFSQQNSNIYAPCIYMQMWRGASDMS